MFIQNHYFSKAFIKLFTYFYNPECPAWKRKQV